MDEISDRTQPKYRKVKQKIVEKIRSGEFRDGSFLPSEDALTRLFAVGRNTIRKAFEELRNEGLVITSKGRQSMVNARAMSSNRPLKIAWLDKRQIADTEPVYFRIYNSFLREAEKNNANVIFVTLMDESDGKWFARHVNELDGAVVAGLTAPLLSDGLKAKLKTIKNIVGIDDLDDSPAALRVCTDNYCGGRLAAEYLISCGYRKISLLGISSSIFSYAPFAERIRGYEDAMREHSIELPPALSIMSNRAEDIHDLRRVLTRLLKKQPDIDAIFSLTDAVAVKCVCALREMNYRVPQHIAVLGYDGLQIGEQVYPSLSTICQPADKIGRKAFHILADLGNGIDVRNPITLIKPELVKRESTAVKQSGHKSY